jgi:hypothetical protein
MEEPLPPSESEAFSQTSVPLDAMGTGEKNQRGTKRSARDILASGFASGTRMVGAVDHAATLLERLVASVPTCVSAASAQVA